jgi:hypothetical protein
MYSSYPNAYRNQIQKPIYHQKQFWKQPILMRK